MKWHKGEIPGSTTPTRLTIRRLSPVASTSPSTSQLSPASSAYDVPRGESGAPGIERSADASEVEDPTSQTPPSPPARIPPPARAGRTRDAVHSTPGLCDIRGGALNLSVESDYTGRMEVRVLQNNRLLGEESARLVAREPVRMAIRLAKLSAAPTALQIQSTGATDTGERVYGASACPLP